MADTNKITYVSLGKLGYYDEKLKAWVEAKDNTLKTELQGNIDAEVTRAKAAELTNAQAAEAAQAAADKAQGEIDALEAKVGTVPEGSTVMGIITNIQESAYDDTEVRGLISGLDANKADKTQVATDIAAAVKAEEDARKEAVAGVQGEVDTLEQTHATDKKALEDAIALKADQTALEAEAEAARAAEKANADAIAAEKERAEAAEKANADAIAAVKEDVDAFFKDADMTESAKDTLKELQAYIASDETAASEMLASIKQNADDIDALEGRMDTAEGKITTAEGKISANETAIDALEAADTAQIGRIEALESAIGESGSVATDIATAKSEAIEAAAADATSKANTAETNAKGHADSLNTAMNTRVEALEAIDHDAYKAADTALETALKKYADDEDAKIESRVDALEEASAKHALASDLTALAGRVETAEGEIDTLQTEMDAVEALAAANKAAHEANAAAIALKAAQADLEAEVTRATNRENEIEAKVDAFEECTEAEINALFTA